MRSSAVSATTYGRATYEFSPSITGALDLSYGHVKGKVISSQYRAWPLETAAWWNSHHHCAAWGLVLERRAPATIGLAIPTAGVPGSRSANRSA